MKPMPEKSYYKLLKVLLHIFIWGILFLALYLLFTPRYVIVDNNSEYSVTRTSDYIRLIITFLIVISIFYVNYYFLIPRFLSKRRFFAFSGSILFVLVAVWTVSYFNQPEPPKFESWMKPPSLGMQTDSLSESGIPRKIPPPSEREFRSFEKHFPKRKPFLFNFGMVVFAAVSFAVSTSIRGTSEWFSNEKRVKEIENQKLTAELSYLKAQINPHFFFNTLNGIYALASRKSDQTPEVILKLSELMRYVIYEANTSKVSLSRELKHIRNYIDLQKIRLNEMIKVNFEVTGNTGLLQIEPLLFSVFLENAFKHGIDYSKPGTIDIALNIEENGIFFKIVNPIPENRKEGNPSNSGLGLKNIRQRLDLVYGDQQKLEIYEKDSKHIVELTITLDSNEANDAIRPVI